MAMQQHQKRCQLPMHQLRHQLESQRLDHVALEQMPDEKRGTHEVETAAEEPVDDVHDVVAAKSDQSQSLTKRLLVSVE
jgi:hypothetical protein